MKSPIKIYFKHLVVFILIFFLLTLAIEWFSGQIDHLLNIALYSIVLSVVISLFFTAMHVNTIRKVVTENINFDRYKIKHSKVINLNVNEQELVQLLKDELDDKNWSLLKESESEDEIVLKFKTPISWNSWGEVVYVRFFPGETTNIQIEITSIPILSSTILDYGKNKNNVDMLSERVKAFSEPH